MHGDDLRPDERRAQWRVACSDRYGHETARRHIELIEIDIPRRAETRGDELSGNEIAVRAARLLNVGAWTNSARGRDEHRGLWAFHDVRTGGDYAVHAWCRVRDLHHLRHIDDVHAARCVRVYLILVQRPRKDRVARGIDDLQIEIVDERLRGDEVVADEVRDRGVRPVQ